VTPVNDAPVGVNDRYTLDEDTTLTVASPGVLGTDTDADGDRLTARPVAGPATAP
jgi:large repetitive protein